MTQYANFDHTVSDPKPVTGWYDTDAVSYPSLPSMLDLLEITDVQWAARLTGLYAISGGALISYTPSPAPTLSQQALAALGAGLTIISTSTAALDGTYDCSPKTVNMITSLVAYVQQNGVFPAGVSSQPIYDIGGTPHLFPSVALAKAWATAILNYVFALNQIVASNTGSLPASTTTIT